jgi:cytochrome c oxidase assembly protein subunit 15
MTYNKKNQGRGGLGSTSMDALDRRTAMFERMALGCLLLLVAVTGLSAFLRQHALPADGQSIVAAARLGHRIAATSALLLVIAMVVQSLRMKPPPRAARALSLALLALALGLAALGVVTSGARAPAVAMGNLLGGYFMLAIAARLVRPAAVPGLGPAAFGVATLLLLQVVSGALLSTTQAGRACSDLAECSALVRGVGWDWHALNPWHDPLVAGAVPQAEGAPAQLLHRLGSVVVAPLLAWLGVVAVGRGRRREGFAVLVLSAVQLALGLVIGSTGLPLVPVLLHNLVTALLLALVVRLV